MATARKTAPAPRQTAVQPVPTLGPVHVATRKPRAIRAVEGETKADRFARLAQLRTANALKAIRLIGQLSAPQYDWTPSQVQQIAAELDRCMADTLAKFRRSAHSPKPESVFRLVPPSVLDASKAA